MGRKKRKNAKKKNRSRAQIGGGTIRVDGQAPELTAGTGPAEADPAEEKTDAEEEKKAAPAESAAPRAADPAAEAAALTRELTEVREAYRQIFHHLQANVSEINRLADTTERVVCKTALKRLADLHRRLRCDTDENVNRYAEELAMLLEYDLALETICPAPGEPYDPAQHMRQAGFSCGAVVRRTVCVGWRKNGAVLLQALVET